MTRRRTQQPAAAATTPLGAVAQASEQHTADELTRILEAIQPFDQGTVKGLLYQKPRAGQGAWKFIDEIYPPFDLIAVYQDMKETYGGGDYQLRVMADGKPRANHDFTIIQAPKINTAPTVQPGGMGGTSEILQMMLAQSAEARREASAAADRQATMITGLVTALVPVLGAALSNRGGGGQADTVALISALQDRNKGGGMTEMIQGLAALKALTEPPAAPAGEGSGVDLDDLAGSAVRLIGPGIRAVGDYMARQRGQGQAGSEAGGPSASGAAAPGAVDQLALGPPASRFPLIDLVRDDVLYMFKRGYDPAKAADLVYDIIEANHVSEDEVNAVAAAFALSPDGLEDLAREGIDLRSRPSWAAEFFAELHAIHTAAPDDPGGSEGSASDPAANGRTGEGGAS